MSWPADNLDVLIEIALDGPDRSTDPAGWTWEDISEYGREAQGITISQGDADEFGETPPATCALTLDNSDGRFSRRNPRGAYYGRLGRNAPIRVSVDPGAGYEVRFFGEVSAWPKRWDRSGNDVTVPISCAGTSRREAQNDAESTSALAGYVPSTNPVAYWPLEDGADATYARSGLSGGLPLFVRRGIMDFTDDAPPGSSGSAHPTPSGSDALVGSIFGASASEWQISIWSKGTVKTEGTDAYYVPWEIVTTTGQVLRLAHQYEIDEAIGVAHWTDLSQTTPAHDVIMLDDNSPHLNPGITGEWIHVTFSMQQSGADCFVYLNVNEVEVESAVWSGVTIGAPYRFSAISAFGAGNAASLNMADIWISQISIHNGISLIPLQHAGLGFPGEMAGDRLARLFDQAGVPLAIQGSADTEPMGPQEPGALMPLARDGELVDVGTLQDNPSGPGMLYVPRAERYNLPYALDLNYLDGDIGAEPEATDDDQGVANRVVMTRTGGGSSTVQDDADIAATGITITDAQTRNVWQDGQLPNQAGWRLRQGLVDVDRWPKISLNLARRPELVPDWCTVVPGASRARVRNFPGEAEPIDVIIEGWTETISQTTWQVDMFCSPASPWTVGVIEDDELGRADTDGSKLTSAFDAGTDTSALVAVTDGSPWINSTDHSAMFPMNVRSGGVVLEVTGIAAAVVDSFGRTVSNGLGTATTGQVYTIDGGLAAAYSVVGGTTGRIATTIAGTLYIGHIDAGSPDAAPRYRFTLPVLPATAPFTHRVAARMTDTNNYYEAQVAIATTGVATLQVFKRVGGTGSAVGSSVTLPGIHAGGNSWWIQVWPCGTTIRARAWKTTEAEPQGWHIAVTDTSLTTGTRIAVMVRRETGNTNGSQNVDIDDLSAPNLQTFAITATPVNGVERTIPAGTALSLATPWRAAL